MSGPGKLFGRSVPRIEDRALVSGRGRYLDDLAPEGCLAAAFVRSPYAHALIEGIEAAEARALPGVHAVLTLADLRAVLTSDRLVTALPSPAFAFQLDRPVLADAETVHVGEPIALVVAETRALAEDAAELVEVDYAPLPAVADAVAGLAEGAAPAHRDLPHNRVARFGFDYGPVDAAFAEAPHVVQGAYQVHRGGAHSLEGRGVLSRPDALTGRLEVWSSTQTPHALRRALAGLLGREEEAVAVTAPDLGGGFGPKLVTYPEEIAVAAASLLLARPVKWVEDRREHFLSTCQERDQDWTMEMALDAEGHILGIRGTLVHDHGAYTPRGLNVAYGAGVTLPMPYNVPAYRLDIQVALTNKVPVTPIRGAGQPPGAFVMERLLDRAARALGLPRDEIRRRNLVRPEQMPCEKPMRMRGGEAAALDSGDYPATQGEAQEAAGWEGFPKRQAEARAQGRRLGIGLANYVEGTGRGPYETATVRIARSGRVLISTGAAAMGQGTATMLAQVAGEQLGGDLSRIDVTCGDTRRSLGFGGFNSRQTVTAGASAHAAALEVRGKLLKVASHLMEVSPDDLEILGDRVAIKGAGDRFRSFAQLAAAAAGLPGFPLPGIETPGLEASAQVDVPAMAYSNGTAVAEVEVDPDTGLVRVVNLVLAHDCGVMVNPTTVEGQVAGGVAHGLGGALYERMLFDEDAQPLTATLADYLMVTAAEMPPLRILHRESPSPLNALGLKGVGESGVIPIAAAVLSAVDDACADLGLHAARAPLSPADLRALMRAARSAA